MIHSLRGQFLVLLIAAAGLFLAGCGSLGDPVNPSKPWTPGDMGPTPSPHDGGLSQAPTQPTATATAPTAAQPTATGPGTEVTATPLAGRETRLRVGDLIKVTFSDVKPDLPPHEERIRDDGNSTLPLNVTVKAVDKNAGQLQEDIRKEYVPRYYNHLTVTVRTEDRVYFVGGEVRNPNRYIYTGVMSVTRALDTAGGFTDYAKKNAIELYRASGKKIIINYDKARKKPELDLEVFPGDRLHVPSKLF